MNLKKIFPTTEGYYVFSGRGGNVKVMKDGVTVYNGGLVKEKDALTLKSFIDANL